MRYHQSWIMQMPLPSSIHHTLFQTHVNQSTTSSRNVTGSSHTTTFQFPSTVGNKQTDTQTQTHTHTLTHLSYMQTPWQDVLFSDNSIKLKLSACSCVNKPLKCSEVNFFLMQLQTYSSAYPRISQFLYLLKQRSLQLNTVTLFC